MEEKRGFWDAPELEEEWPRCVVSPLCPTPPPSPAAGTRLHLPRTHHRQPELLCLVNQEQHSLTCPSFLRLYIQSVQETFIKHFVSGVIFLFT